MTMGLDAVELVMAWEDAFGIDIPDAAAAVMYTPNHAIDYIALRLGARRAGPCRTRSTFLRVRDALAAELGLPPRAIHPASPLSSFFSGDAGRERWTSAGRRLRSRWPDWPNDGLLGFLDRVCLNGGSRGLRLSSTVSDLVRHVAAHEPGVQPAPGEGWTRERVALLVRRITIYETGIDGFRDDQEFVRDLGAELTRCAFSPLDRGPAGPNRSIGDDARPAIRAFPCSGGRSKNPRYSAHAEPSAARPPPGTHRAPVRVPGGGCLLAGMQSAHPARRGEGIVRQEPWICC
jgi:hypothetical protein